MPRAVQWLLAFTVALVAASGVATVTRLRSPDAVYQPVARVSSQSAPFLTSVTDQAESTAVRPAGDEALRLAIGEAEVEPQPAPAPETTNVVLWGDSLGHEAASPFTWAVQQVPGFTVETRTWGGTAACDWYAEIMQWPDAKRIDIAVLVFSGNSRTPCMRPEGRPLSGPERVEKYRADVEDEALHLRDLGATVYLMGPPVFRPDFEPNRVEDINAMYIVLADRHEGVEFVDAGAVVLDGGKYADRLPCAPWEGEPEGCVAGTIAVRSPDGVHFCPVKLKRGVCSVFSPGAFRFAMAMAKPITSPT